MAKVGEGDSGPIIPIQPPTDFGAIENAKITPPKATLAKPVIFKDGLSQNERSGAGSVVAEGFLPKPEESRGTSASSPIEKYRAARGLVNKWIANLSMVNLREAMEVAAAAAAKIRKDSRETSMQAALWIREEGKSNAEMTLKSGETQAKMTEAEARQHYLNGWISIGTAALTVASYGASKAANAKIKSSDTKLRQLGTQRDAASARLDNMKNPAGPKQGPVTPDGVGPNSTASERQIRAGEAKVNEANQNYAARENVLEQRGNYLTQMMGGLVSNAGTAVREFTESATKYRIAELTKEKAVYDAFQKMCDTYEKLAQKMMQSSDQDARDMAELMNKLVQQLDQMIDAAHKAYGIGTH